MLGVNLILVSIGKPEKGRQLIDHLEIANGEKYLFVDPENALYDDLLLNKGVKETFFSPSTPFSFLDRFTKKDGMKELMEVLSKWSSGTMMSERNVNQLSLTIFLTSFLLFPLLYYCSHFHSSQAGSSLQSGWHLSL
jgi:AhpC/TSA antioxidant enzyme